jgi:hypothetical protein
LLLDLNLFSKFHELLINFLDVDLCGLGAGSQKNLVVLLVVKSDFVSVLVKIGKSISVGKGFEYLSDGLLE